MTPPRRLLLVSPPCSNATATAYANPDQAWTDWLKEYNVSYASTEIASYRRSVFNYNLARAYQLNQLAGPDVAVSAGMLRQLAGL